MIDHVLYRKEGFFWVAKINDREICTGRSLDECRGRVAKYLDSIGGRK